jgi:hypothetical protein
MLDGPYFYLGISLAQIGPGSSELFFEKCVTFNVRAFGGFHRSVLCILEYKRIVDNTRTLKFLLIDSI